MNENPYAASVVEQQTILAGTVAQEPTAREVFVAWEKLRLIYNGVLAVMVLLALGRSLVDPLNLEFVLEGAVGANVAYCVGPVCEGYLALFGIPRRGARWFVFLLGTFVGAILAMAALSFHVTMKQM